MCRLSAHNNLSKCIASLPYFTQHYTEACKPKQRCAVCYKLRETCSGIKRFVYEGMLQLRGDTCTKANRVVPARGQTAQLFWASRAQC